MSAPIQVTVTFPLGKTPFHADATATQTIGELRSAAMNHFGVSPDSQTQYYLTHNGQRLDDTKTVGDVAGPAHGLKLTLVKELIQGNGR